MLITEGRSRAGEGVVTKGQDRPDRSGLVPMTFNSLSHSETGGGISGSWSFGLEARQRTVGKRSPGRGSHVDGLFWAPEEAGLGAFPTAAPGAPRATCSEPRRGPRAVSSCAWPPRRSARSTDRRRRNGRGEGALRRAGAERPHRRRPASRQAMSQRLQGAVCLLTPTRQQRRMPGLTRPGRLGDVHARLIVEGSVERMTT